MTDTQVTQVGAEAAATGTPDTQVTQLGVEVAYTPAADTGTGSGTLTGGGGATRGQFLPRGEMVEWTVDNVPVTVKWDGLTARANGGFEQADLVIPAGGDGRWRGSVLRGAPQGMQQGSLIRAYRENGDILYEARVGAEPISFQGETRFWTKGAVEVLRDQSNRLPFQLAGGAGWGDRSSDPYNYSQSEKFDLFSKDKFLGWMINDGKAYSSGNKAGYALLVSGRPLKRIAFTLNKTQNVSNFDLELYVGDDAGTLTLEKTWALDSAHPDGDTIDYTLNNTGNTLSLVVTANGAVTPGTRTRIWLTKLRVNGIGTEDDTSTSEIITKISARCDFRTTGIISSGTRALPLDWEGSWGDLAESMRTIDDWYWFVGVDQSKKLFGAMTYGPYGGEDKERTWRGTTGEGLDCSSLVMLPRYNHVDVAYESPAGVRQVLGRDTTDINGLTDPYPDDGFPYPDLFSLDDPQDDQAKVKALADAALRKFNDLRVQGPINVSRLLNGQPYDILPGDLIHIGGHVPDMPPQRIASVTYLSGGTCRLQVERTITVSDLTTRVFRKRIKDR